TMIDPDPLPHLPGCYLFKDASGEVIYVGKARDLKKRVASYFQKRETDPKTAALVCAARGLDFIVTDSEVEALLLENSLIKKNWPKYNVRLKDSSRYASIHITDEEFPRIHLSRSRTAPGSYFGPFVSARERDLVFSVVRKTFGLRTCRRLPKRACLRHAMGACCAPCIGKISAADYGRRVGRAEAVLKGRTNELIASLKDEMSDLAGRCEFEQAMELRDEIRALVSLQERQNVERNKRFDEDVLTYAADGDDVYLMLFKVYKGTLEGKEEFVFPRTESFLEEFIVQYYSDNDPPEELIVGEALDGSLVDFLSHVKGRRVRVTVPKQGEKRKLLDLADRNLLIRFFGGERKLAALAEALSLPEPPKVIEVFDVSTLAGSFTVGSMVPFRDGRPDKKGYRRFKIRTVEGIDDFASIGEIVRRRYSRLKEEAGQMPDLIVIDGGKGQLFAATREVRSLGLSIPVISIAKREEEIYVPGRIRPLPLRKDDDASLFVREMRDEAHRFAVKYNRLLQKKAIPS
ncbi:MAG: excinuclease ABC subunit UvrC, partial [Methanothrix sp.]